MSETRFTETEALLLALGDNEEALGNYLLNNFLPGELTGLIAACETLKWCAKDARRVLLAERKA